MPGAMSRTRVSKTFYDNVGVKSFTRDTIEKDLKIDKNTYKSIQQSLEKKLEHRDLAAYILNTRQKKLQLLNIFKKIYN